MRRRRSSLIICLLLLITGIAEGQPLKILVCTKTNGFRHKAIPVASAGLVAMAKENNWQLTFTEDSLAFSRYKQLKKYNAIILLFATGKIFGMEEENAVKKYVEKGGGLVTIHTGTDCEKNWDWYMKVVGARFKNHPKQQQAKYIVVDSTHLATRMLPREWLHFDEIYNFATPVSVEVRVLLTVDELSYTGGTMGNHPIAWCVKAKKGRIFQTALGHTDECYSDKNFLQHIYGGIRWAARLRDGEGGFLIF